MSIRFATSDLEVVRCHIKPFWATDLQVYCGISCAAKHLQILDAPTTELERKAGREALLEAVRAAARQQTQAASDLKARESDYNRAKQIFREADLAYRRAEARVFSGTPLLSAPEKDK